MHAWPGGDFHTTYYGWTHGGTTDGSLKGRKGYPAIDPEILNPAAQAAALRALDLPAALGLTGYRTVVHAEPLSHDAVRAPTGRHAAGTGPCYAELMVESVTLQADYFSGRFVNALLRVRRFADAGDVPASTFATFITTKLASGTDGDPVAAATRAREAFGRSVTTFGATARKGMAAKAKNRLPEGKEHK